MAGITYESVSKVYDDGTWAVEDFNLEMTSNPGLFPESYTRWGPIEFMPPEGLLQVEAALEARGYPPDAVTAILGGNFRRVAGKVWPE